MAPDLGRGARNRGHVRVGTAAASESNRRPASESARRPSRPGGWTRVDAVSGGLIGIGRMVYGDLGAPKHVEHGCNLAAWFAVVRHSKGKY